MRFGKIADLHKVIVIGTPAPVPAEARVNVYAAATRVTEDAQIVIIGDQVGNPDTDFTANSS